MVIIYLALGSNLGNRKKNIETAIRLLRQKLKIMKISSISETKPVGYKKQRNFYNCVFKAQTMLCAHDLLVFSQNIEKKLKREKTIKNGPRTIDIDILFYGNKTINTKQLILPHPRMHERDFVVVPLQEIGKRVINKAKEKTILCFIDRDYFLS